MNFYIKRYLYFVVVFATFFGLTFNIQAVQAIINPPTTPFEDFDKRMHGFDLRDGGPYTEEAGQPSGAGFFNDANQPMPNQGYKAEVKGFREGSCMPVVIEVENQGNDTTDIFVNGPHHGYNHEGIIITERFEMITTDLANPLFATDLNQINFSGEEITAATSFKTASGGSVEVDVHGPYGHSSRPDPLSPNNRERHYDFTLHDVPAHEIVYLLFCGRLSHEVKQMVDNGGRLRFWLPGYSQRVAIHKNNITAHHSKLTIIKEVINDNDGSKTVDDFELFVDDNRVYSEEVNYIAPGEHSVSELDDPLYKGAISGDCDSNGVVELELFEEKTCIITNDDQKTIIDETATLTVIKHVINDNEGTAEVSDFPLFIDGIPVVSGETYELPLGLHAVSETNMEGYQATFNGDCNVLGKINLRRGDNRVCLITNDDLAPKKFKKENATLTILKHVINDNDGTAEVSDFPLTIDELPVISGGTYELEAGLHTVSEINEGEYLGYITGDCNPQGKINLKLGDDKICLITNDDLDPDKKPGGRYGRGR